MTNRSRKYIIFNEGGAKQELGVQHVKCCECEVLYSNDQSLCRDSKIYEFIKIIKAGLSRESNASLPTSGLGLVTDGCPHAQ